MNKSAFAAPVAAVVAIGTFLVSAREARAQDAQPATTTTQTTTTQTTQPGTIATTAPAVEGANEEKGRLRIGFNINGGVGSGGDVSGPVFGGTFRIGWQLNRLMGVYGNITPFAWVGSSDAASAANVDLKAIAGTQLTPMFSLTPIDLLEVAAGPSLDYLTGGGVSNSATNTTVGGYSSVYFGLHGRVALHLGGRNEETGRRRGFTIGGDIHPTFAEGGSVTFFTLGLGADWY